MCIKLQNPEELKNEICFSVVKLSRQNLHKLDKEVVRIHIY